MMKLHKVMLFVLGAVSAAVLVGGTAKATGNPSFTFIAPPTASINDYAANTTTQSVVVYNEYLYNQATALVVTGFLGHSYTIQSVVDCRNSGLRSPGTAGPFTSVPPGGTAAFCNWMTDPTDVALWGYGTANAN